MRFQRLRWQARAWRTLKPLRHTMRKKAKGRSLFGDAIFVRHLHSIEALTKEFGEARGVALGAGMRAGAGQFRSASRAIALAGGWSVCLIAPAAAGGYADQYGSGGYGAAKRYGNYSDQYGARNPIEDQAAGPGYADQFSGRPFQAPPPPPKQGLDAATTTTDAPTLGALDPMQGLRMGAQDPTGGPATAGSNGAQRRRGRGSVLRPESARSGSGERFDRQRRAARWPDVGHPDQRRNRDRHALSRSRL